ncbi:hypothetical protein K1T71_013984 [Dendrolimus kikuchii]|uniref:Uncharacterized protein n=1 Tax=Dendrolimus kikuchii TaxID=765133 RepID=A0ACC1CGB2_9NEOP|nr:hypothetical protein K1T71_013984 [Dendrolimus kikuchii]
MYLVLLFTVAALFGSTCRSASVNKHMDLLTDIDNNIDANVMVTKAVSARTFLTITQRPSSTYAHVAGTTLSLTCDALASPAPSIHWYKNDAPVYETLQPASTVTAQRLSDQVRAIQRLHLLDESTLDRLRNTVRINRESTDTPQPTSPAPPADSQWPVNSTMDDVSEGLAVARATTLVYSTDGSTDLSERTKLFPLEPHIVVSYKMYVDNIGNNIVLPCRVKGHPRPHVTWRDNKGVVVKRDPRMKVLHSGELVITSLRWSDMGEYICQANNMFGSQLAKTFVYPAKAE